MAIPADVNELLARYHGVLVSHRAQAAGIDTGRLIRLKAHGFLTRIAPSCYVSAEHWRRAHWWERHRLASVGLALVNGPDTYLAEWSAVTIWGLPTIGPPPSQPTALRPRANGHRAATTAHGHVRVAKLPIGHTFRVGEVGVMGRAWTAVDLARSAPLPHALIVADAAARTGADLDTAAATLKGWSNSHRCAWVAEHADPRAESPLETLGRFACIEFNLPMPVSNAWIGATGPEYRADGLWPWHWVVNEGDGGVKVNNRPDASAVVSRQQEREWQIRRLGAEVVRYDWNLAYRRRPELADRFAAVLAENPPRATPMRWWKHVPGTGPVEPGPADWPSPAPSSIILPAGRRHGL